MARSMGIVLGMGVNEVVRSGPGNGTIYNSFLLFDADGSLRIHHRKLMPTYTEKMLYGLGDSRKGNWLPMSSEKSALQKVIFEWCCLRVQLVEIRARLGQTAWG